VTFACTDTGLTNGQIYYYFVSADNSVGTGAPSNVVNATPVEGATPTLTAALSATPANGTEPLSSTLTATAGGTAAGTVNYTFWWNCSDAGTNVDTVATACGDPTIVTFGAKFNGVNNAIQAASTTYAAPGTYSAKVIIERGSASPAEKQTSVKVASGNPSVLAAPAPSGPSGNGVSTSPTFGWSAVNGASSYRLMLATASGVLPSDPVSLTCSSCAINTTPQTNSYTPSTPLNAATTYYWQVQGRDATKSGTWSGPVSFTTAPPPEQTPPDRGSLPENSRLWPTPADKAVVITHGWNSSAADWVEEMSQKICAALGAGPILFSPDKDSLTKACQASNWDVWVLDWHGKSTNTTPWTAFANASDIGENLAITLKTKNYSHIHFIAHSAGANLIDFATIGLKYWITKENRRALQIHETFLDAYDPTLDVSRYGKQAEWADNYVDTRDSTVYFGSVGLDGTKLFLQNAYNIDVTPSITPIIGRDPCQAHLSNPLVVAQCRHGRPYRFYGLSIDFVDDAFSAAYDPIDGTGGKGYPLSLESGHSLSLLSSLFPNGDKCVMDQGICYAGGLPPSVWTFLPGAVANTVVDTVSGDVNYVAGVGSTLFNSIHLDTVTQPSATRMGLSATTSTASSSSISVQVTTAQPVNTMRFNWSFPVAGEGFLRVFVDGILMREIDQRHVPQASLVTEAIYIGGDGGMLPPATHRISFILDGFGASASKMQLTGVELGLTSPTARRRAARP
jgi:pimeloyl-ACP methyl ester carboxylesterase